MRQGLPRSTQLLLLSLLRGRERQKHNNGSGASAFLVISHAEDPDGLPYRRTCTALPSPGPTELHVDAMRWLYNQLFTRSVVSVDMLSVFTFLFIFISFSCFLALKPLLPSHNNYTPVPGTDAGAAPRNGGPSVAVTAQYRGLGDNAPWEHPVRISHLI